MKITRNIFGSATILMMLGACVSPTPPATVALPGGATGLEIYTSIQTTSDPTEAELAQIEATLAGPGRGNLADRATQACPSGYDVVSKSGIESSFAMALANGVPTYRVSQKYVISCS